MTDEKNPQEAKIRSGLSAKRNPVSYQTTRDIVILAGTMFRSVPGEKDVYETRIGTPGGIVINLTIDVPGYVGGAQIFKRVIAA